MKITLYTPAGPTVYHACELITGAPDEVKFVGRDEFDTPKTVRAIGVPYLVVSDATDEAREAARELRESCGRCKNPNGEFPSS